MASKGERPSNSEKSVTIGGVTVDLSDNPLKYGGLDRGMSSSVRSTIEAFEAKRYNAKIEYDSLVGANGNVIEENRGGHGSVQSSIYANQHAVATTHNHPREAGSGTLGGTFSTADLDVWLQFDNQITARATAAEGTYSISRTSRFDKSGFKAYYTREFAKARASYKAAEDALQKRTADAMHAAYKADNMSEWRRVQTESKQEHSKVFNSYLIAQHNILRDGAKKYGYNYTLERRNKNGR